MIKPDRPPEPENATVLVVEDEVLIRLMVSDELREAGFRVVEAANADDALAYLQAGERADLVFSDVRMPGSMDGIALAEKVRTEYPSVRVVLTSGHLLPREIRAGLPFLAKPYELVRLRETLAALLQEADDAA